MFAETCYIYLHYRPLLLSFNSKVAFFNKYPSADFIANDNVELNSKC